MTSYKMPFMPHRDELPHLLYATFFDASERKINRTFIRYLNELKSKIDYNSLSWSKYKQYTNPYEFIHTNVPDMNRSVSALQPLSRSYYKMIEICETFEITKGHTQMKTFHLAEGPGGFIEALSDIRENPTDTYHGMTLVDNSNSNVPGWKNSSVFLESHPNVKIEYGVTQNGDISSPENLRYCFDKYQSTMDLVTGDAGIDYSFDFAMQEDTSANLILCQIAFACAMLKSGGTFILKTFDISNSNTVDMIYFLSLAFDSLHIFKPETSRYANSERYVVCHGFRFAKNVVLVNFFYHTMNHRVVRLFTHEVPYLFANKLEEVNAMFGQQQVENILMTLSLLENPKPQRLEAIQRRHIGLCHKWCERHRIPTHSLIPNNIFTQQCLSR